MDWSACCGVDRDGERVGGAWCFAGTRVTVRSLFDNLDRGATVDEFIEWFPAVREEQVHAVLAFAQSSLDEPVAML